MTQRELSLYKKAAKYWENVPATIDGVLGGYGYISDIDIDGSKAFLHYILHLKNAPSTRLALDCGAGIGRVSKLLLTPIFDKVDLVDQNAKFIEAAKDFIGENITNVGNLYVSGLQDFKPLKEYDVIWCQWVIGHLNDYDLRDFLQRCANKLAKNGVIVIKENITSDDDLEYDEQDSSVIRPLQLMLKVFKEAKLKVIKQCVQTDFPDDIYSVYTFALVPVVSYTT